MAQATRAKASGNKKSPRHYHANKHKQLAMSECPAAQNYPQFGARPFLTNPAGIPDDRSVDSCPPKFDASRLLATTRGRLEYASAPPKYRLTDRYPGRMGYVGLSRNLDDDDDGPDYLFIDPRINSTTTVKFPDTPKDLPGA